MDLRGVDKSTIPSMEFFENKDQAMLFLLTRISSLEALIEGINARLIRLEQQTDTGSGDNTISRSSAK